MQHLSFRELDIDDPELVGSLTVASNFVPLWFLLKWSSGQPVSLFALHGQIAGAPAWTNLLSTALNDNDGEITVPIGQFPLGTTLNLRFGVFPFVDIAKAATFIVRPGLVEPFRPELPGTTQPLKRAEAWRDSGPYKV